MSEAFDPDAFLSGTAAPAGGSDQGDFDPDGFLGQAASVPAWKQKKAQMDAAVASETPVMEAERAKLPPRLRETIAPVVSLDDKTGEYHMTLGVQHAEFGEGEPAAVVAAGHLVLDPKRPRESIELAAKNGWLADPEKAKAAIPGLEKAEKARQEWVTAAEKAGINMDEAGAGVLAQAYGMGRGAASVGGAMAGGGLASMLALRSPMAAGIVGVASAVGGGIAAGKLYDAAVKAGGKYVDTLDAVSKAAEFQPGAVSSGEMKALILPVPGSIAKLARGAEIVAAGQGGKAAAGFLVREVGGGAGIGTATALVTQGIDSAIHGENRFDLNGAAFATALGAALSGANLRFTGYNTAQVAGIIKQGLQWQQAMNSTPNGGVIPPGAKPLGPRQQAVFNQALPQLRALGNPDPATVRIRADQVEGLGIGGTEVRTGAQGQSTKIGAGGFDPDAFLAATPTEAKFMAKAPATPAAAAPVVAADLKTAGVQPGAATTVFGARGVELPAVYAWAPTSQVQTSHSGEMMAPNPRYALTNTRDYSSPEERDKQLAVLKNFDARRHVTDAPDASVGPALVATVIDDEGQASLQRLGGNNRGYAIANLPADKRAELRKLENDKAGQFGLDPTSDPDAELVRYLGTFDFRTPGERERAQGIVDVLNPAPGMVQGNARRAQLDAATVPPAELRGLTMDIAPKDAQGLVAGLIAKGHADRNLTAAIASNPTTAQDYAQRLLLQAAYRQPAVAEARMDTRHEGGPVRGMIDAAVPALMEIRAQGEHGVADAITRAFTTSLSYLDSKGSNLPSALDRAAAQTELTPGHEVTQGIAGALRQAVATDKAGRVDAERTVENTRALFDKMAHAVSQRDPNQGSLFGEEESVADIVKRALSPRPETVKDSPAPTPAVPTPAPEKRIAAASTTDVKTLRAAKDKWVAGGRTIEGAEALVAANYASEKYARLASDKNIYVPMPSTSGRNTIPGELALRLAKDHGGQIFHQAVAVPGAAKESKFKTTWAAKLADPVTMLPIGAAVDQLRGLVAKGGRVILVDDVQNTGESFAAVTAALARSGVPVTGYAALGASDLRLTSPADIKRLAGKLAEHVGVSLDEAQQMTHAALDGSLKQWFNLFERGLKSAGDAARIWGAVRNIAAAPGPTHGGAAGPGENSPRAGEGEGDQNYRVNAPKPDQRQMLLPYAESGGVGSVSSSRGTDRGGLSGVAGRETAQLRERAELVARLSQGEKVSPAELHAAFVTDRRISSILADASQWNLGFNIIGAKIENPIDFATLNLALRTPQRETLRIAAVVKFKVVASTVLHVGAINESLASPRVALAWLAAEGVPMGAHIIIAHNHPSGDPEPSDADKTLTIKWQTSMEAAGYNWMDHIVTNGHQFYTFRGGGMQPFPVRTRAPWEMVEREKLGIVKESNEWTRLVGTLRTGDPDAIHVIYLTTKLNLAAIERLSASLGPDELSEAILHGVGREAARFVAVSFPAGTWAERQLSSSQWRFRLNNSGTDIKLIDYAHPGLDSARAVGILETTPAALSPGEDRVREDEETRQEIQSQAGYSPLQAVDEKGNPYAVVKMAGLPNMKIVEMPELVQLARDLTGELPQIKRLRGGTRGQMVGLGNGQVKLDQRIFSDPIAAAKTLGHEIGHIVDYLPQRLLQRGNLWGRIHSLRAWLKERWTPSGPKAKELRAELIALSQHWKPYNAVKDPPSYVKYRESGVELYADFVSVLFNSPATAKAIAPTFWREFWRALPHAKADVHDAITGIQAWLAQPMALRLKQRSEKVDTMFAAGEETFERKFEERRERYRGFRGLLSRLKQGLYDQYAPGRDRAKEAGDWDLVNLFDGHPLARNEHWRWLERMERTVTAPLEAAGWSMDDLGRALFYDRVSNESYPLSAAMAAKMGHSTGGRSVIANPLGHTPATARLGLLQMRLEAGGDAADPAARARGRAKIALLEAAVAKFHHHVLEVMREAHKAGMLTDEQMAMIEGNASHYAAFVPLEYVDTFVPAAMMHQAGTFKEIANPFLSTVLKVLTMQRAIQLQRLKVGTVEMMKVSFPGEIDRAQERRSADGRTTSPVPVREKGRAQIMVREEGKPAWYNVPAEVALMFEHTPTPLLEAALDVLRVPFQKFFYPLFITYNPIFQMVTNPIRDARRTAVNRPAGVGLWSVLRQLPLIKHIGSNPALQAVQDLVKRAGLDPAGNVNPLIAEMLDNLAIAPGDATFAATAGVVENAFDRLLQEHGLLPPEEQAKWWPKNWPIIGNALRAIERAGKMNELLPKVSAYRRMRMAGYSPKEAALYVRSYIGTPNFGRRGKHASVPNTILPFYNIWTKGWGSDAELARRGFDRSNGTKGLGRAAWWLRLAAFSFVPRLLSIAAKLGLMGYALKKLHDGIGAYDRKNYDVIPLGYTGESDTNPEGKVAFLRVPKDPTDRVITGIFGNFVEAVATKAAKAGAFGDQVKQWNAGADDRVGAALMANFSVAAYDLPGINPILKIVEGWRQYLSGQNPRDDFRGQHILSDAEFLAGGWPATKAMTVWTLGQAGTQNFVRFNPQSHTVTEIAVDNTPIVNGLLKISDLGYRQAQTDAKQAEQTKRAEASVSMPANAQQLSTEYWHLRQLGQKMRTPTQQVRYLKLNSWYEAVYTPAMERLMQEGTDGGVKDRIRDNVKAQSKGYER